MTGAWKAVRLDGSAGLTSLEDVIGAVRDPPLGRSRCALWASLSGHRTVLKASAGCVVLRVVPWTLGQRAVVTLARVRLAAWAEASS
jgi:hypothetical protein